jgi:hypothetical protein
MWQSRRDFQRVWEGWEAGLMAFHAFHTLSFPWPAFQAEALTRDCDLAVSSNRIDPDGGTSLFHLTR